MLKMVQYDLLRPEQNYSGLIEEIKKSQDWARPVKSTWFVYSNETPGELLSRLSKHLDGNDLILVNEVKYPFQWSARSLPNQVVEWIRKFSP